MHIVACGNALKGATRISTNVRLGAGEGYDGCGNALKGATRISTESEPETKEAEVVVAMP